MTKRKLRQYPPRFGLATYHVMTWEPEIAALGMEFCKGVGLRGIGVVEFKRDPRDGVLKLIECNARFTLATELVHHSGVNLAQIAYYRAVGLPVEPVNDYRVGARMWYPIEDARTALVLRREGELTLRRWLRSVSHRQHSPLWSWRDPVPSLHSLSRLPAKVVHRSSGGDAAPAGSPPAIS
jgi:D-aspartate ligase